MPASIVSQNEEKEIRTTSLVVAEKFNKRHKTVIRAIENLPSDEFSRHNFMPRDYIDARGKAQPMFEITRDGFSMLCMGFTGKEAYKWKLKFIEAFNKLERAATRDLKRQARQLWQDGRAKTKLSHRREVDVLKIVREVQGKYTKAYHYSNESLMINQILTGHRRRLDRESLDVNGLELLERMETANAKMIPSCPVCAERKEKLIDKFKAECKDCLESSLGEFVCEGETVRWQSAAPTEAQQ